MRVIFIGIALLILSTLLFGGYLPQPVLAVGFPKAIPTSAKVPPTKASNPNPPVINLGRYKLTQTAIALTLTQTAIAVTVTNTPSPMASITPTTTVVQARTPTILKPNHLPNTGNVDSSDIWQNLAYSRVNQYLYITQHRIILAKHASVLK
jgi:hypothetical protein